MMRRPSRWSALLVPCAALGVFAGYGWDVRSFPGHGHADFHCVQGSAYGDAVLWHEMGYEIAEGMGWRTWPGRRPLYGWFLAGLYAVSNNSYHLALLANVLFLAGSVYWIFQIGLRLDDATTGVIAAAGTTLNYQTLMCGSVTLSEPLGLFLLTWHFWLLLEGVARRSPTRLAASGALLALSNAARTLTLMALPFYALAIVWRLKGEPRRALACAASLVVATALITVAFLTQNYLRNGIFSLSDNTAGDLCAATDPRHGEWTPDFQTQWIAEHGQGELSEIYHQQMTQARQNLREHPGFFLWNVGSHVRIATQFLVDSAFPWLVLALVPFLPLQAHWRATLRSPTWWGLSLALALAKLHVYLAIALLCACVVLSIVGASARDRCFVAALLVGTTLAVGIFGSRMERLFVMYEWSFLLLIVGTIRQTVRDAGVLAPSHDPATSAVSPSISEHTDPAPSLRAPAWPRAAVVAAATFAWFLTVISAHLFLRNLHVTPPRVSPDALRAAAWPMVDAAMRQAPELFRAEELAAQRAGRLTIPSLVQQMGPELHGQLFIFGGAVGALVYPFERLTPPPPAISMQFRSRDYDRVVVRVAGKNSVGTMFSVDSLWPAGAEPRQNEPICLLGRVHGLGVGSYVFVEGLAWRPWAGGPWELATNAAHFAIHTPEHRQILQALITDDVRK